MDYLSRTIVALDNVSAPMAIEIMEEWKDKVHGFKVNHTLYPQLIPKYFNLFVDYKLYDIPNTMTTIIERLIDDGAQMVTVHMNNARSHIEQLAQYADKIKLLGVTLLTSWENHDIMEVYGQGEIPFKRNGRIEQIFQRSCQLMIDNGFYGAIVSPEDLDMVKHFGKGIKSICPGIRMTNAPKDDQVRICTPRKTLQLGADYLVMGRSFFDHIPEHRDNIQKSIPIYPNGHGVREVLDELYRQEVELKKEENHYNKS